MKIAVRHRKRRIPGLYRNRSRPKGKLMLAGVSVVSGATVTFFGDSKSGARRRALVRDRTAGAIRRLLRRSARRARVVGTHGLGWSKRVRHLNEEPKEYDDATLTQKVQTELFRPADAPKGTVDVNVANGIVQLRGEVERPELIDDLVQKVHAIQGVHEVESFLHLPPAPAEA
jgi:BON domain